VTNKNQVTKVLLTKKNKKICLASQSENFEVFLCDINLVYQYFISIKILLIADRYSFLFEDYFTLKFPFWLVSLKYQNVDNSDKTKMKSLFC
jgi:hypothetical protein